MRFEWRKSETNPGEKLSGFHGLDKDMDDTPVAMFKLVNGQQVGLSMQMIGDLVENHNQQLESTVLPGAERQTLAREIKLARAGADALALQFNELLDDRLRPYTPRQEAHPGPAQKTVFDQLMLRIKSNTCGRN